MTAHQLAVVRRPRRRTHLSFGVGLACGTVSGSDHAHVVWLPLIGGPTTRLRNDLTRELDGNACLRCTRIGLAMLALYASRDTGRAW